MRAHPALALALLLAPTAWSRAAEPARPKVTQPGELPTRTYAIPGKPSEVVQNLEAVRALAGQMERDLRGDLERFDIQAPALLQSLHTTLFAAGLLRQDYASAQASLERVRGLAPSPVARLTTGLFTAPLIQARLRQPGAPEADLRATYRSLLAQRLAELPFAETQGLLRQVLSQQKAAARESVIAALAGTADAQVREGRIGEDVAGAILGGALALHVTQPMKADIVASLEALFAAHPAEAKATKVPLRSPRIEAKGAYFGQALPGTTPVPFAPELLKAVGSHLHGIAFSPKGDECFLAFGTADYSGSTLYRTTCVNGTWTPLEEASFATGFTLAGEPVYLEDGGTLLFTAKQGEESTGFWVTTRTDKGWGAPKALPEPLNSKGQDFRGSFEGKGTFYFGSDRTSPGSNQVHRAVKDAAGTWTVEKLGAPFNQSPYEGDPCVAPDGRFLVTYAARPGGQGRVDLFVSFPDGRGGWGPLANLGPAFNSADEEWGACLSWDGKYLFFTRHNAQQAGIFWVSVEAIDRLRR